MCFDSCVECRWVSIDWLIIILNDEYMNVRADIFYTKNFSAENSESLSWNLDSHMKVFDAELFAMKKTFKLAYSQLFFFVRDIWIFSDSQAAIQRVQKSSLKTEQSHVLAIENWVKKIQTKHQADIHLS